MLLAASSAFPVSILGIWHVLMGISRLWGAGPNGSGRDLDGNPIRGPYFGDAATSPDA